MDIRNESKEFIKDTMSKAKGNINATRQSYDLWMKEKEGEIFAESLKMKMTLESKVDEIKSKFED